MKKIVWIFGIVCLLIGMNACGKSSIEIPEENNQEKEEETASETVPEEKEEEKEEEPKEEVIHDDGEMGEVKAGETASQKSIYTDENGDQAVIPAQFTVSALEDEQTIDNGLVVIGPDGSEYVWIPTTETPLSQRDFGRYFSGLGDLSPYYDEETPQYLDMVASVNEYGGFYIGRFEASRGDDGLPASKRITEENPGSILIRYSPQQATEDSAKLYSDNETVEGFFLWGANWDTCLQWLIDSGDKTEDDIKVDSSSWGNYTNDEFSVRVSGNYTGAFEEAKSNNIYDLAGNNWEWTQERFTGGSYVMRGGGYNIMGGACNGDVYPVSLRDPLPGNDHHPNVCVRVGLFIR